MDTTTRTLKVLEWDTILEHLSKHASCETGVNRCLNVQLYSDIDRIKIEQSFTTEARRLLDSNIIPPFGNIIDVKEAVELSRISQSINSKELIDIAKTIQTSRLMKSFFSRYTEETPLLFEMSLALFENKKLEEEILNTFDHAGEILDDASPELKSLKRSYKDNSANLKSKVNSLINSGMAQYLQEVVYTTRNDRIVFPVKVEFKTKVPGIVHDVSSSGATLFIEPKAIVEMNNNLKEIEIKIEHEIERILSELTKKVGQNTNEILSALEILTEIDFTFAKAKYSIALKAVEPTLSKEKFISLKGVKHPILMNVIDNVIPNDVEIGKDFNVMIITGSNTGGKTVTLKSIGLSVLMTKAGLHIPALEANIYPFSNIFADIGDEQSVIQSLSTFSSHMTNIISIIEKVDNNSLVILDEIGAGTDPAEGSSLAQAILEELQSRGSLSVVSTHYGELKALAYTKKGFENASVEFNRENLAPTYKLLIGIPGTSNAISISLNLGLNENIAKKANEIYLTQKDTTAAVLEGLQNTQQELTKTVYIAKTTKEEAEKIEQEYSEKLEKINSDKKKTLMAYKKKFETEMAKAKSEIKEIMDEIRKQKSEKIARRAFNKLNKVDEELKKIAYGEHEILEPKYKEIDWNSVKIGDTVLIKDLGQIATLLSYPDKNNNLQVQIGMLKTTVKMNKIAKSEKQIKKEDTSYKSKGKGLRFERKNVSQNLDLRGMRVEDAIDSVEDYLDEASLANLTPVCIIHGHGTGALKQAVRDYLKDSPYVAKFRPGDEKEGGDGVSIVELV